MKLSSGYEQKRARVEMLPLIDIVFLLLVFFIYAMLSMVVHRGLRVELPEAATAQLDRRDHVTVTITAENAIYVDKAPVGERDLAAAVGRRMVEREDVPVFVSGDAAADLGVGIRVLDILRQAGIRDVSFQCREERE